MKVEDKILKVSLELFSKYGYTGTSTKRIAKEAEVNEVTIFRKFENKSNLFQQVISKYAKDGNVIVNLKKGLTGDLNKDIEIFGLFFYDFLKNNELMYKLQIKQVDEKTIKFTNSLKYKEFFTNYLEEYKKSGEFQGNPEEVAVAFISMIMGLFTFKIFTKDLIKHVSIPELITKEAEQLVIKYVKKRKVDHN